MASLTLLAVLPLLVVAAWWLLQPSDDWVVGQLKGTRVIVCGASTGIGEQIAYIYARGGARIVLASRRDSVLQRVQAECEKLGAQQVERLPVDLSTANASAELIHFAEEKLGGVDVLVLNHIMGSYGPWTAQSDLNRAEKLISVNLLSYIYLATHALPALERSHGTIAVVSSVGGKVPVRCTNIYAAAKFGLTGFFESLRLDLALQPGGTNISISIIPLGLFKTERTIERVESTSDRCLPDSVRGYGDARDAAMAIIRTAFFKVRQAFYPGGATVYYYLYMVSPWLFDVVTNMVFAIAEWMAGTTVASA